MAKALYFSPAGKMSLQQYTDCTARLKAVGAGHPTGRLYHAAFGTADDVKVFDVWTSMADFDKFGQALGPVMQALGIGPAEPHVMDLINVITPPAPRPKAAAGRKAPAKKKPVPKKAAGKKAKAKRTKGKGKK